MSWSQEEPGSEVLIENIKIIWRSKTVEGCMSCCSGIPRLYQIGAPVIFFIAIRWFSNLCCVVVGSSRKAYRTLGLFWAGSLCANMSVFIAGIVAGEPRPALLPAVPPADAALIKWTSAPLCPISVTVAGLPTGRTRGAVQPSWPTEQSTATDLKRLLSLCSDCMCHQIWITDGPCSAFSVLSCTHCARRGDLMSIEYVFLWGSQNGFKSLFSSCGR